mmetsp:Transcript_11412/g.11427  ORF Transcript_11412/g.11427 Transcript_11412/m.11427 type:complete len:109 (-) Transcript_11412:193-519(-)
MLLAVAIALVSIPTLPQIIEALQEMSGSTDNPVLNDKASGFFNACGSFGQVLAPIVGGLLNTYYGFRITCDFMGLVASTYTVIYLFINVLPDCFKKKKGKEIKIEINE